MDSKMNREIELSQEKNLNEINSNERKYSNDVPPAELVERIGCDLKDNLTDWSNVLRQCRSIEDETLGQLDDMLKQAYRLEADCLRQRLNVVNKMIENKK